MAAAEAMLVGAEEPQRLNQMQMLLGTGHGDIQGIAELTHFARRILTLFDDRSPSSISALRAVFDLSQTNSDPKWWFKTKAFS